MHLSFPEGSGVNAYIAEEYCKVKYSSFDGVLDMISSLEKGAELGKIDIKQAFRLLIVNPTDFDLLGIQFEGKYWVVQYLAPFSRNLLHFCIGWFNLKLIWIR